MKTKIFLYAMILSLFGLSTIHNIFSMNGEQKKIIEDYARASKSIGIPLESPEILKILISENKNPNGYGADLFFEVVVRDKAIVELYNEQKQTGTIDITIQQILNKIRKTIKHEKTMEKFTIIMYREKAKIKSIVNDITSLSDKERESIVRFANLFIKTRQPIATLTKELQQTLANELEKMLPKEDNT